jgi:hypothetical protein
MFSECSSHVLVSGAEENRGFAPAYSRLLLKLALANGVAVSTLYWGQAVVARAAEEFGPSLALGLMPGATLAGYAGGVAVLAWLSRDLTAARGLAWHFGLLAGAALIAGAAPVALVLTAACLGVGAGAALTQRLLVIATSAAAPGRQAQSIGWIIAAGLLGIVVARSCIPLVAAYVGWRPVFWADAGLAGACGWAAAAAARVGRLVPETAPPPSAIALWHRESQLRLAALQQAGVFAAFNMGWALFPRLLLSLDSLAWLAMAGVPLLGAAAALGAGRFCRRVDGAAVARAGTVTVGLGAATLALGWRLAASCCVAMSLIDAGTQIALVANQARAQSLADGPAMRGRLAAIVTTVGFLGGAAGSALGNLLAWRLWH